MAKRALIAEPDHEEALKQAAILQEDGYEAHVFSGQDVVAEVERNAPDVLILRQERPGAQTGLALVARLKSVAAQMAIVITTTDLTPEAIEKNKKQKVHADGFLRIPADRGELIAAASALPSPPADPSGEGVPVAGADKPDPRRPPPLPPSGLRGLTQARMAPRTGGEAVLSADDLTFVEKVFSTIQHVDIEQTESQPPTERAESGDRKVVLLRTELKRRERELAKLSRLWKAREEDLRQKEARVEQKDIEIEGLRLRIQELSSELDKAHVTLVDKEAEFGKAIGETYDNQALQQAELIQQVAGKENELNALRTKLRKTEDGFAAERKAFTERVFEWEKAYADLEQHHWKVVEASVEEVVRLEAAVRAREADRKGVSEALKAREGTIAVLREKLSALTHELRAVEHAHGRYIEDAAALAEGYAAFEKVGRVSAEDDARELQARLYDVEQELRRHQQGLLGLERQRLRDVARVVAAARAQDADTVRLMFERDAFRVRAELLDAALNEAKALGEATAMQLFALEEKRRIVMDAQIRVRDERTEELREEVTRLSSNLSDVTERLAQSEMDHAAEHARADELDTALAQTREASAETEHRLATELETRTAERDKLTDSLQRTEHALTDTREQLTEEKSSRKQREMEVASLIERKDNDLATRNEKLVEFERSLGDAKEDLQNLRKTVTLRDERITELLNRARQADEQQVALEGQVFRLTSAGQEKDVELQARGERLDVMAQKAQQREERMDALEQDLRKSQALALDKQAQLDRQDQAIRQLQTEVQAARDDGHRIKAELDGRSQELFESERKASGLLADLQNARGEIATGHVFVEQLQNQLSTLDARSQELRRLLDDTDAKLRNALVDLDAAGQRGEQMRVELGQLRERGAAQDKELNAQRHQITELERARDGASQTAGALQAQVNEIEQERHTLEEQLAAQLAENGELSASLSDAAQRLDEAATRSRAMEAELAQREGRIAAQQQVLQKAEQQLNAKDAELSGMREDLADARGAIDDAKAGVEERSKWLAAREASIAELKGQLEVERRAKDEATNEGQKAQQQLLAMKKGYDELRARLDEREKLLQAQGTHAQGELEREMNRAERMQADAREARTLLEGAQVELTQLRAEAARVPELRAAEEKIRADALKLRQIAEKAANDAKAARILLEKTDAQKKQLEVDAAKARAEVEDIRTAQKQADAFVAQARIEGEQRLNRLRELEAQVQRANASRETAERARQEAEAEAARARADAQKGAVGAQSALGDEVQRLMGELQAAKKQQNDALAAARQAKLEVEQIKRLAAEKIRQAQAGAGRTATGQMAAVNPSAVPAPVAPPSSAPPSTTPPTMAPPRPAAPPSEKAQPTMVLQRPNIQPPPPGAGMAGLAPPLGAPAANAGVHMPNPTMPGTQLPSLPSMPSLPSGAAEGAFDEQKTAVVNVAVPSAARNSKP